MRELSAQYPRYGYRRIRIFLGRGGYRMSPGRAYRLWRAAGLQLPRKSPGELEMTRSTSDVAVCCCSDSRSSLRRRVFSMAMTAWSAKLSIKGAGL
jgi:HTH-like domain